ncbi:ATPases of the AAA+ class [Candidatus Rhodobacter oscarellae]|uniref:ATPases of the AAA+ class n=1 Tax=Candidatus Rhodobacter oscarellae TaxID=1675527 RepID=A0A0J9GVP4_9RHOB|nr:hypothetical protein [Candidatus Rhodobacter lobularis]KMW57633.1 ATPases of the AAA+ class [Candidatus Rhodobacter lobularis]
MYRFAPMALAAALLALPAQSQDSDLKEGVDLLSEGTRLLMRGLMGELEPTLRELEGALRDWQGYHPPEVLPNGDIIIRRKHPKPVLPDPDTGEIDL